MNKKEFLLQTIIKAYLEHLEPIGSIQLKNMYDISFSPATIRGYFKKLGDEGFLAQEHISSGRIPTVNAFKNYWNERLDTDIDDDNIDIQKLETISQNMGISVFIKHIIDDYLQEVINVDDRYMIIVFDTFSISVEYNDALFRFLNDMKLFHIKDLSKVVSQVGAYEVSDSLDGYIISNRFQYFNIKDFLSIAVGYSFDDSLIDKYLKGKIIDDLDIGLYYENLLPSGYIGICSQFVVNQEQYKMLVIGELSKDYEYFYNNIKR